ncbi:MAG: DUF1553 domain-containing protein, partial [Planctomycetales bacterium]|nr:DUF1553 domain-containing protein [Planctomycetales bacterium]
WQHHFGRGIVATPSDLGAQGEPPTHPELLEWLAHDLVANGWQLKRLHKLMMTSSAYMQSSEVSEANSAVDPENRYLWRFSPRRLEAEVIRDAMLSISGQLDTRMFGAGTTDESMKRRSVYFMMKRSKLIPMMQLFDQPEPLVSQGDRPATTIAPQALMFMNNPHVRSYAVALAGKLPAGADGAWTEAVAQAYRLTLGRGPTEAELADSQEFLAAQTASYEADKKGNARALALADFCQTLFSLNEFVFVE